MAAKEKKSAVAKQLNKDNQMEKSADSTKLRRGRKLDSSVLGDGKSDAKSSAPGSKKRKENSLDGRTTPSTRKRRNATEIEDEQEAAKTPPPSGFKVKKTFLERELEDILENATGRNTPSTPRNRKGNEKEDENGESDKLAKNRKGCSDDADTMDDKGGLYLPKIKGKDVDDDNVSVRSFSTLRTRRNLDKDDDDVLSVRSMSLKSKRSEANNEDSASVSSLSRSNAVKKVTQNKKTVPVVVKKKIFLKKTNRKKGQTNTKTKISNKKKAPKKVDELNAKENKKLVNKPLKYPNIIGGQRRLRSAMLMKKQKLKKAKLKTEDKGKQKSKSTEDEVAEGEAEQLKSDRERLRLDSQNVRSDMSKAETGDASIQEEPKKDGKTNAVKKKVMKKDGGKKAASEVVCYQQGQSAAAGENNADKMNQRLRQTKMRLAKKLSNDSKKRKRLIHFETTSCPDDSSVILVQPRLGPKKRYNRQNLAIINKSMKKMREILPKSVLPVTSTGNSNVTTNFNQIGGSYFVQSIPNFKLVATNSTVIRSYNSNRPVNPNYDSRKSISSNNMPYVEEGDRALTAFDPKMWPNDMIVTPSGIVLSSSRIISTGNHPSNICINGPNSGFVPDSSSSNILYSAQKTVGNVSTTEVFYQNSSNVMQPQTCTKTTTAILLERPESMSTSLISTSGTVVIPINTNGGLKAVTEMSRLKGLSASTQTYTIASEKALEGDAQSKESAALLERLRNTPNVECLPKIPVAKNVNELLLLKSKFDSSEKKVDKTDEKVNVSKRFGLIQRRKASLSNRDLKRTKRLLRNVRQNRSSASELTFSEPESSCCEVDETPLYKTISYERLDRTYDREEGNTKVLLQLGSEPMAISESIAPFETASAFLLDKSGKTDRKLKLESDSNESSPKTKDAIEVCSFSKENAEALRELGLDSDLDQTKSDPNSSPVKTDEDQDMKCEASEYAKKERIKEEVDNVLKEMPNRKIPNLLRKSECFNLSKNKVEMKNPLVLKNNDYLTKSPSKPPTVIDKLLERNKSLKKAEQESRYQNSVRNLSENLDKYENDLKHKRSVREVRARKYTKGDQRRLVASKRFINTNSGCKVFERRGSNPEIYSNNCLTTENTVSNENVPLRRALEICENREKYQRRGSIDFESIQKVMERRSSLPIASENSDDVKKIKTENVKTILIRSSTPLSNKNHGGEQQTRVINIITGDDGSKKGQNLMEEIGMEIEKDALNNSSYMNGDKEGRRTSVESSNSESDSLKKLMDGITVSKRDGKSAKEVPYSGDNSLRVEKIRLSIERKNATIEESPEDLVKKETILSALGLQRAASQNAQKKDTSGSCQSEASNYTGTLKTVIKIQRQEKKGNSKAPMKMIYKASSSSSSVSGQTEEPSLEQDMDVTSKDEMEEESKNGNGKAKSLVIPEKASSFSIHPGRMCSDVCTYCFGKFGLLDTPCHIAQLKDAHKRRNILAVETHLLADSCLCDACFRHVDKKSNCQASTDKKVDKRKFPSRKQVCCARNCNSDSQHKVRRKWFMKLKKSIGRKVILDPTKLEKLVPTQLVTLCHRHFYWVDYFMSCGICKKRLTSVNMCKIGVDVMDLNAALSADGIPTILTDKRFICKICQCYASILLRCKDPREMTSNQSQFYEACRKRILQCHEIDVADSEGEPERDSRSVHKNVKKTKKSPKPTATVTNGGSKSDNETEVLMQELDKVNDGEKDSDMKEVSHMNIPPKANSNLDFGGVSITPSTTEVNPTQIHVKLGNLNIGALGNLNIGQDVRHGTRPGDMQCFPTEAELALRAHFDLQPAAEDESAKTARKGFEKCMTTIQFNPETKNLFYSLQMPYGNHSSFFRHLILLEKYFRSGDLVVARNADPKAVNYISSVQNRIRSYEGIHSPAKKPLDIPPSLSILPQPLKTENRNVADIQPSVIQSRPFTLTPMPSNSGAQGFPKNSPLSHIQATVQNIPAPTAQSQGFVGSLLKSANPKQSHLSPEISITSVPPDLPPPTVRIGKNTTQAAAALTSKIQENLRNLASKSQNAKPSNQARAVILNRTVGGQKQSLVQVTTGGKTIHLTLYQFRRIQQMQMRKKQYLEHQARAAKMKEETTLRPLKPKLPEEGFDIKHLSPELEIQEVKPKSNGNDVFPLISEVRSLAGEDANSWEKAESGEAQDSFPKIPKALSVSVTKIAPAEVPAKEQSVEPAE